MVPALPSWLAFFLPAAFLFGGTFAAKRRAQWQHRHRGIKPIATFSCDSWQNRLGNVKML